MFNFLTRSTYKGVARNTLSAALINSPAPEQAVNTLLDNIPNSQIDVVIRIFKDYRKYANIKYPVAYEANAFATLIMHNTVARLREGGSAKELMLEAYAAILSVQDPTAYMAFDVLRELQIELDEEDQEKINNRVQSFTTVGREIEQFRESMK